jgi:hypothetical protein
MGMQMRDAQVIAALCDDRRLGQIRQMTEPVIRARAAAPRDAAGPQGPQRTPGHPAQGGLGDLPCPGLQQVFGPRILGNVGGIDEFGMG